jgi:hypothetical protein
MFLAQAFYETTDFIAAMAGAFAGAFLAFLFGAIWEQVKRVEERRAAIVKAQHVLIMQANDVENLLKFHLNPTREIPKEERPLKMAAIQYPFVDVRINNDELAFLAAAGCPEELRDVLLAERCFLNTVVCIENYNALKKEHAAVVIVHDRDGDEISFETPRASVGLLLQLESRCVNMFKCADEALPRLLMAVDILARTGKRLIPKPGYLSYLPDKSVTKGPLVL